MNSAVYHGPFTLTNSAAVQAFAAKAGAVNSGVASAQFLNSSAIGTGTGLLGQYFANQLMAFVPPPTLVRTDAVVNFNWNTVSPDPSIPSTDYTVRWTGMVQPQFNETYTFSTTTDDVVRLWVNGQLIIDEWIDQGPTTWSGTIALQAQQYYNIQMDYYQNQGGAVKPALMGPIASNCHWANHPNNADLSRHEPAAGGCSHRAGQWIKLSCQRHGNSVGKRGGPV